MVAHKFLTYFYFSVIGMGAVTKKNVDLSSSPLDKSTKKNGRDMSEQRRRSIFDQHAFFL